MSKTSVSPREKEVLRGWNARVAEVQKPPATNPLQFDAHMGLCQAGSFTVRSSQSSGRFCKVGS